MFSAYCPIGRAAVLYFTGFSPQLSRARAISKPPTRRESAGLETCDLPYAKRRGPRNHNHNHNLERLIDWSQLPVLDAGLRFRNHPFAQLDDENLTKMIDEPLKVLCMEVKPRNWMVEATYADYPLRDKEDAQQTWRFNYQEGVYERFEPNKQGDRFINSSDLVKERPKIFNQSLAMLDAGGTGRGSS